jgi:5'-methylthioadenosine phosphorylase
MLETPGPFHAGIIGGTGMAALLAGAPAHELDTPFGPVTVTTAYLDHTPVAVLLRHGPGHAVLPHQVNYRANLWALRALGVRHVFATAATGSLDPALAPGCVALLADFLDFTRNRPQTFAGTPGLPADAAFYHADLEPPYCPHLSNLLRAAAADAGPPLPPGIYACMEGPRFESPAEIRMLSRLGATVVGMTGLPEAVLARELGLCYASLAIITNVAVGLGGAAVDHDAVNQQSAGAAEVVTGLLRAALPRVLPAPGECCPAAARRRRWFGE